MRFFILFLLPVLVHAAPPTIKVDGSSTVFPVTEAVAEEFQSEKRGKVRVTVGISGTGGGFKKFCRGETDVQNASRPILKQEMEACRKQGIRYFELAMGYDAIAVVTNPKNDWMTSITATELNKMWEPSAQGKVMKWSDVNAKWPKENLKLYGAGADSGTFDYFTEAVNHKGKASRGDYTASEDDNTLVQGVASDRYAIGYLPLSYYEANKGRLKLLAIVGGPKSPKKNAAVLPNEKTVTDGSYYPLSRPFFIYVSEKSYARPEIKEFTHFYLNHAIKLVKAVSYIPLPEKAYKIALGHLQKGKVGTIFNGEPQVGMTIEEMLKKEATQ